MPTLATVVAQEAVFGDRRYQYLFTPKHHGADPDAAQWLPSLTLAEEFAVFATAVQHDLSDDEGRLYSVQPDGVGGLSFLGTDNQQIAEFPFAREGEAWHGYPSYPLGESAHPYRKGEKGRPAREVFDKIVRAGLITVPQRKRLMKGKHA